MTEHHHAGHRKRLKQQLIGNNFVGAYPHQLLEMLLFYSIPVRDTNELAHSLIDHFGGFEKIFSASVEELSAVKGIGLSSAVLIKAALSVYAEYGAQRTEGKIPLDHTFAAEAYYGTIFRPADGEQICVSFVDDDITVINTLKFSVGGDGVKAQDIPKKVTGMFINSDYRRCVIAHYLPTSERSGEDERDLISQLVQAAKLTNTAINEYFVIAPDELTVFISDR